MISMSEIVLSGICRSCVYMRVFPGCCDEDYVGGTISQCSRFEEDPVLEYNMSIISDEVCKKISKEVGVSKEEAMKVWRKEFHDDVKYCNIHINDAMDRLKEMLQIKILMGDKI